MNTPKMTIQSLKEKYQPKWVSGVNAGETTKFKGLPDMSFPINANRTYRGGTEPGTGKKKAAGTIYVYEKVYYPWNNGKAECSTNIGPVWASDLK